jgi:hypothetical protein
MKEGTLNSEASRQVGPALWAVWTPQDLGPLPQFPGILARKRTPPSLQPVYLHESAFLYMAYCAVQLRSNVARITQDGLITLAIKYVHFFVSRCLQFRYLSPLQPGPSNSMLFWVAFTRSISSMSNDIL